MVTPQPTNQIAPTATTPNPDAMMDFLNSPAGNVTPEMPSYTERKATGENISAEITTPDAVNILGETPSVMSATNLVSMENPVTTPVSENFNASALTNNPVATMSTLESTPVTSMAEMSPATASIPETSVQAEEIQTPSAPSSLFADLPSIENGVSPVISEAPVAEMSQNSQDEASAPVTNLVESMASPLFSGAEKEAKTPLVEEAKADENTFDILGQSATETPSTKTETAISDKMDTPPLFEAQQKSGLTPDTTAEFLSTALAQLDEMEKTLQTRKQKFLDEAAEYKVQKEVFATREKEAREKSHSMDDEQSRIDTMRNYFKNQQKKQTEGSDVTESVNTTLTAVGVKNSVDKAIEAPVAKKPRRTRTKQAA